MKYLSVWADQYGTARVIRDDNGFRVGKVSVVFLVNRYTENTKDSDASLLVMFAPDNGDPEVTETYRVELL